MSAPSAFARKPSCVSPDTAPAGRGGSQKDEVKAASRAAHHREEVTQPTAQAALSCRARAELGSPRSRPPAVYAPGARGTRGRGGSRVSCPRVPRPERKGPTDPRRPRRRRSGAARPEKEREKPYSAAHAGRSESQHPLPAEGASTPQKAPKQQRTIRTTTRHAGGAPSSLRPRSDGADVMADGTEYAEDTGPSKGT